MEKKITEKVSRFIELSEKFAKGEYDVVPREDDVVPREEDVKNTLTFGNTSTFIGRSTGSYISTGNINTFICTVDGRELYIDKDGNVKAKDNKKVTRADEIKAEAEIKAQLLEEYYEYKKLMYELKQYFTALEKINE